MISLKNVSYRYKRREQVLDSIFENIELGSLTGVVGLNGGGKTTLMKLLAGLLKPKSGSLSVFDHVPFQRSKEFLQQIFFVPDHFQLPANLSVSSFARRFGAFYPRYDHENFYEIIDSFSVNSAARVGNASAGQLRKILISVGFATQTKVMLMDEPMSGMDIPSRSVFRNLLVSQMADDRKFVISTHEVRELSGLFDQLCILGRGSLLSIDLSEADEMLSQVVLPQAPAHAIYSEDTALGNLSLVSRHHPDERKPDTELLFRAFLKNPDALRIALSQEGRV